MHQREGRRERAFWPTMTTLHSGHFHDLAAGGDVRREAVAPARGGGLGPSERGGAVSDAGRGQQGRRTRHRASQGSTTWYAAPRGGKRDWRTLTGTGECTASDGGAIARHVWLCAGRRAKGGALVSSTAGAPPRCLGSCGLLTPTPGLGAGVTQLQRPPPAPAGDADAAVSARRASRSRVDYHAELLSSQVRAGFAVPRPCWVVQQVGAERCSPC